MRLLALFLSVCGLGSCAGSAADTATEADWRALLRDIRDRYPNVSQLPLDVPLLEQATTLRVDVREPNEYAVSHLHDAENARDVDAIERLIDQRRPENVVLYCSVGYRSSALAEALRTRVSVPVHNLEGSLFAWANAGRQLSGLDDRAPTVVHPFNERWGRYLAPAYRAPAYRAGGSTRTNRR